VTPELTFATVAVSCWTRGARIHVRFRSTSGRRSITLRADPADEAMIRLFVSAHRGPFGGALCR
jgi:hypothetical protein